jgi:hypothetical protein
MSIVVTVFFLKKWLSQRVSNRVKMGKILADFRPKAMVAGSKNKKV